MLAPNDAVLQLQEIGAKLIMPANVAQRRYRKQEYNQQNHVQNGERQYIGLRPVCFRRVDEQRDGSRRRQNQPRHSKHQRIADAPHCLDAWIQLFPRFCAHKAPIP